MSHTRLTFDLVSAFVLFVIALGGALLPSYLKKRSRNFGGPERGFWFQLGNMLSAGVMLSAGFCHLLPEALPDIQPGFEFEPDCTKTRVKEFPLGTFLSGLGLLVTLVADQIAQGWSSRCGVPHAHGHSRAQNGAVSRSMSGTMEEAPERTMLDKSNAPSDGNQNFHHLEIDNGTAASPKAPRVSILTAVLLSLALSLHSVLEGAALGAQKTVKSSQRIMIAIAAHKGLAAYALGASLGDSPMSAQQFWVLILGFSLASPFGILLGYGVSSIASGAVSSSLSALASGTFLYVALFEVIPKELAAPEHKASKIAVMLLGFGLMSVLAIWA